MSYVITNLNLIYINTLSILTGPLFFTFFVGTLFFTIHPSEIKVFREQFTILKATEANSSRELF